MSANSKVVSIELVNRMIQQHSDHMRCWKMGLVHGSLVYFEMGKRLWEASKHGALEECGSGYLSLEGDRWTISERGNLLATANNVTREIVEENLAARFLGESLLRVDLPIHAAEIIFSGGLQISFQISTDPANLDTELFVIGFPGKWYVTYSPTEGLLLSST